MACVSQERPKRLVGTSTEEDLLKREIEDLPEKSLCIISDIQAEDHVKALILEAVHARRHYTKRVPSRNSARVTRPTWSAQEQSRNNFYRKFWGLEHCGF